METWIASRSLSSGAHSRDPLARNDGDGPKRCNDCHTPRRRVSSTLRPIGSITGVSGILDPPPSRGTTTECEVTISRRIAPEVCHQLPALFVRGRREDRVLAAPAVSRAICANKSAHEHTGTAGASRPSLRNGLTAYFVLFPVNGFLATVAAREASLLLDLTPAPRRQNHTTSPYASGAYVSRAICVHRISPHVRDDREPPLNRVRRAELCD